MLRQPFTRAPDDRGRPWLLRLRCSCGWGFCPGAEQLGVVVGGLGLRAHRRVDPLGVLANQDPPGPRSHPVEDDPPRLTPAQRRLAPGAAVPVAARLPT